MANFPTVLDTLTSPTTSNNLDDVGFDHVTQHTNANTAINNIETKLGINSSAVTTTIDYLLKNASSIDPGHHHTNATLDGIASSKVTGLPTFPTGTIVGTTDSQSLSSKTITAPKIDAIKDSNGNVSITITANASAVNGITIDNASTGFWPVVKATGNDNNINLQMQAKGTGGIINNSGVSQTIQSYSPISGGTATLDLSKGNIHHITMPAGNITIALSNVAVGQPFVVRCLQDGVGSRTVTWFTTIKWAGGVAPTLTTTASKADTLGFICTSAGNYDGYIVGQNL